MSIIRYEELGSMSYWCNSENGVIGFIALLDGADEAEEYEVLLTTLNIIFFTNFSQEQFTKSIEQLTVKEYTDFVKLIIQYPTIPKATIINATRIMHKLYGSTIELDETTNDTSINASGYKHFMDEEVIVFVVNRNGLMGRYAFTSGFLSTFFDSTELIETDVFNDISNVVLYRKLIEYYFVGIPGCREELRQYVRNK